MGATVRVLIDGGADMDARDHGFGRTPLHVAAAFGTVEVVRILIAAGANVNAQGNYIQDNPKSV